MFLFYVIYYFNTLKSSSSRSLDTPERGDRGGEREGDGEGEREIERGMWRGRERAREGERGGEIKRERGEREPSSTTEHSDATRYQFVVSWESILLSHYRFTLCET